MKRGYIRVSTKKQGQGTSLADQRAVLQAEGCQVIYEDVYTGASMDRPEFDRLCSEVQAGDTVVVCKLDRIARTETEAYNLVVGWVRSGVRVHVLNMGLIEDTDIGRLILHIMLAFAEFERDLIVSRCQGGRAYKRATDPDYREGRKPGYSKAQLDHAVDLLHDHSFTEVAAMTGISRSTVTREARKRGFRKSEL
ncbi:recombinase family protein [uncultured Parabacteroides sp.]|uniref:recombinase family protein n=1 Tax=uncultured Parabacteroides sp. TaxID=512312 RepID=UPI00272C30EC|nr:recombinase family protein [uncultured Parabacteroides sp.]